MFMSIQSEITSPAANEDNPEHQETEMGIAVDLPRTTARSLFAGDDSWETGSEASMSSGRCITLI
jgi:hypothetical protein